MTGYIKKSIFEILSERKKKKLQPKAETSANLKMRLCPPKVYTYMYLREKQSITRETPGLEREGTAV